MGSNGYIFLTLLSIFCMYTVSHKREVPYSCPMSISLPIVDRVESVLLQFLSSLLLRVHIGLLSVILQIFHHRNVNRFLLSVKKRFSDYFE